VPVLSEAGYFAVAPNQRSYSADARPDPTDFDSYRVDRLIDDGARHRCGGRAWRAALPSRRP
jgi:hypothetical protein